LFNLLSIEEKKIEKYRSQAQNSAMRYLLLIIAVLLCSSCGAEGPSVVFKGERFSVELAQTPDEQALGLMFRESLEDDHGMLFLFPSQARRSFWMKNCRIPLDIFYFDEQLKLVSVAENAQPCKTRNCPSYPSSGPAKYVLELNAGKAAELGAKPGDVLELDLD
jgi:uncharacterized membrane protein (UPF0127 family)